MHRAPRPFFTFIDRSLLPVLPAFVSKFLPDEHIADPLTIPPTAYPAWESTLRRAFDVYLAWPSHTDALPVDEQYRELERAIRWDPTGRESSFLANYFAYRAQ
jgi:hypothetical protein